MTEISSEYVDKLPEIYKRIFHALWMFNPRRKTEYLIPIQSLFSVLSDDFTFGEVSVACESMVERGVLEKKDDEFVYPTELGESILLAVTGKNPVEVEPFPLPPVSTEG
jgi:hypothetical protein